MGAFSVCADSFSDSEIVSLSFESGPDCCDQNGVAGSYLKTDAGSSELFRAFGSLISGPVTVSCWIKIDSFPENGAAAWTDQSPMTVYRMYPAGHDVAAYCRIYKKRVRVSYYQSGVLDINLDGVTELETDQWYHITVTDDGVREIRLYVNGVLDAKASNGFSRPAWVGINLVQMGGRRHLLGGLDELRVFNKSLLSEQVTGLMKEGVRSSDLSEIQNSTSKSSSLYGWYPALKVKDNVLHPLIDQLCCSATVLPWYGANSKDLLLRGADNMLGTRTAVYRYLGEHQGLPVYDSGTTIKNLPGKNYQAVVRENGLFDIYANGYETIYGKKSIIRYVNCGVAGAPKFGEAELVFVDGEDISSALGSRQLSGWCITDVDGDQTPDLLFAGITVPGEGYWPFGQSPWSGRDMPHIGAGKGYDVRGQWLGGHRISEVFWAKGSRNRNGDLSFSNSQMVYDRMTGNSLKWLSGESERALNVIECEGKRYLLQTGSVDEILAFQMQWEDGDLVCAAAENVLGSGPTVRETYFPAKVVVEDMDNDGVPEILLDGNPGRIVMLKGSRIGAFEEVGSVLMKGGSVAGDTLVAPCRVDWTGNGADDLIVGDASGWLVFWPGTDDATVYGTPTFMRTGDEVVHHQAGYSGSIQGPNEKRWGYLKPTVGHWNGDSKPDLISNDIEGRLFLYERTDDPMVLTSPVPFALNGKPLQIAWRAGPAIIDSKYAYGGAVQSALLLVDWNGNLSVGVPHQPGGTNFSSIDKLTYEDGSPMIMCGPAGHWGRTCVSVVDWDEDGVWDVVCGSINGCNLYILGEKLSSGGTTPLFIRNIGSNSDPVFARPVPIRKADGSLLNFRIHTATPWPTDLDGDGRLDLLVGAEDGKVYSLYRDDLSW
ncbi:LamG-like jellyroll fold domain-containing protein [Tichowtungia aerotolerans]|uniref:LamG-like jellyroll fold domain-containing protein n=1 Tax=Tichowtungia aerotolerans TaxID=2697043 RepID=A0A6P1M8N6_9BACT|nr:LamG-like jellyroll fold domain-containing protein [Tichowtungia aerotolerans]QHI69433.1 hypothetical protein GT409_08185 [Tichowtungia aerotolerans]